jgi:ribosomal protein S18 acetylase RimI-like enzyme
MRWNGVPANQGRCIHSDRKLVHYWGFTAGYWRFASMGAGDLQIGDTWTDPRYRGPGLAQFALRQVIAFMRRPVTFFLVLRRSDQHSIDSGRRKRGFEVVAEGEWKKPFGIKFFGSYVPTRTLKPAGRREPACWREQPR